MPDATRGADGEWVYVRSKPAKRSSFCFYCWELFGNDDLKGAHLNETHRCECLRCHKVSDSISSRRAWNSMMEGNSKEWYGLLCPDCSTEVSNLLFGKGSKAPNS